MMTADVIRTMLIVDMVALVLLALIYIRQRKMSIVEYCCWSLLAIILPVIGPFIVIANRPGQWEASYSVRADLQRVYGWLQRLLPEPPPKLSRLEQARKRRKKQPKKE
jgi:hypothetical protein